MKHFLQFPISHGFSDKSDGSFMDRDQREAWFSQKFPHIPYFEVHQKHTNTVLDADATTPSESYNSPADAIVSSRKNIVIAVKTADCVPILLYDPVAHVGAAIHSGWKGTLGNIVKKSVQAMKKKGASAHNTHAVLGPAINSCCYEVSRERLLEFTQAGLSTQGSALCLAQIVMHQLAEEGINHITGFVNCTSCQADTYFSYRREGPDHGTIIAYICL